MALKEQQIAMEVDEREGMVRDYLEMPLPERWDKMDIFDRRNYICGSEFGGEREPGYGSVSASVTWRYGASASARSAGT